MEAHHLVSDRFLDAYDIDRKDGIAINMHKSRHKATPTYKAKLKAIPEYYNLSPREALAFDIKQVKAIYRESGFDRAEVNRALKEVIRQWEMHPSGIMNK